MEAWIAGLLGTLVGAMGSVAGIWIQNHYQARRERMKLVMDIAVQDRNDSIELNKNLGLPAGPIAPIALFAHYHAELFKLIEKGRLTEKNVRNLYRKNTILGNTIAEVATQNRKSGQ